MFIKVNVVNINIAKQSCTAQLHHWFDRIKIQEDFSELRTKQLFCHP